VRGTASIPTLGTGTMWSVYLKQIGPCGGATAEKKQFMHFRVLDLELWPFKVTNVTGRQRDHRVPTDCSRTMDRLIWLSQLTHPWYLCRAVRFKGVNANHQHSCGQYLQVCIRSRHNSFHVTVFQLRFEYDSSAIRAQHATTRYEVFRALAYEFDTSTRRESRGGVSYSWLTVGVLGPIPQ